MHLATCRSLNIPTDSADEAAIEATYCIDATGEAITVSEPGSVLGDRVVNYSVFFRSTCDFALDAYSVACYTRDGVEAPGHPNRWFYLEPYGSERQYYWLGTYTEGVPAIEVVVSYVACRAGNRHRCERAEIRCP